MNEQIKQALIDDLKANGWGDFLAADDWANGGVAISAEVENDEKGYAGIYMWEYNKMDGYDDFGTNEEINTIARRHGCFAEWINPGVFGLYEL